MLKKLTLTSALTLFATTAFADCAFENEVPLKSLTAGFEAWKAVTDAMAECGNFTAELDQEFKDKQPEAFAASPSLYQIGGVSNGTLTPLMDAGTIRPLDDLIAEYAPDLDAGRKIQVNGETLAIAMMVNNQHLMYREDILNDLGIEVPATYEAVLEAAAKIKEAGVVDYPLGGTFQTGWNLGEEFINMYYGYGGDLVNADNTPNINNEAGVKTLEMLKALSEYMDPEFLAADSTYVQQQFQQGKIAIANLWASRAAAMNDEAESQVVGKVKMASAPTVGGGSIPASTNWWDGIVIAKNITDEEAAAAFRVAMEGMDEQMVTTEGNNDLAVWLIPGYVAGELAEGAMMTAKNGARPYSSNTATGAMHTALGDGVAAYLTGEKDATTTLADIEAAYTTAATEAGLIK